jgi:hypothetical protein
MWEWDAMREVTEDSYDYYDRFLKKVLRVLYVVAGVLLLVLFLV